MISTASLRPWRTALMARSGWRELLVLVLLLGLVMVGEKKMTHGGDLGLEELRLQERVVAED
jgi:hypothetical protein